jgi:hypothetical protein
MTVKTAPGESEAIAGPAVAPVPKAGRGGALVLVVVSLVVALAVLPVAAKEKKPQKQLSGTVLDGDDNPIDGAAVTLTDLTTGKKIATYTDREGRYLFAELEVTRDYEVQATYQGVSSRARRLSQVDPRNRIVFHLRIPPEEEEP